MRPGAKSFPGNGVMVDGPLDEEHLNSLMNRMAEKFIQQPTHDSESVREVVLVGPMLDREHFCGLITHLYDKFKMSSQLRVDILLGMVQLVQDAPIKFLEPNDLTRLLWSVRQCLEDSTLKDQGNTIYLALAAIVLLSATPVGFNLDQQDEPLLQFFSVLKRHEDPPVKVQVKYNPLHSIFRYGVVHGSGHIDGRRGVLKQSKSTFGSSNDQQWLQDIRKAKGYVRNHIFSDLKKLVCQGPSAGNINFQWHACQLLGEIAVDSTWTSDARDNALAILHGFIKADGDVERDLMIKRWALTILKYISESPAVLGLYGTFSLPSITDEARNDNAQSLVQEFEMNGLKPFDFAYPLTGRLPLPTSSPLLHAVTTDPDVEFAIGCLRRQRSKMFDKRAVYIELLSKQSVRSSEDVLIPLQERARNFLKSNREVLLVLGDSGAGKSTFGMHLENDLWDEYKPGGPIPLFIDLKTIDELDKDLVQQHLEDQGYFSDQQVKEMRRSRQFILICDGYDECRRWINLHNRNRFNTPRQWQAKVIISCRTQYIGPNYRNYFEPDTKTTSSLDFSHTSNLFEEAVIVPFRINQIKEYIELFTRSLDNLGDTAIWTMEQYMERLGNISHLMELVQNPFMLKMIMDVLPRIAETTTKMTRVELYDNFVAMHFESEQHRLLKQHSSGKMDNDMMSTFTALDESDDLVHLGLDFSKQLSLSIFKEQDGRNSVTYSTILDNGSWKDMFFGPDNKARLLRESAQLVCRENRQDARLLIRHSMRLARKRNSYEFSHRSILEYFFSCLIFDPRGNEPSLDLTSCLDSSENPGPIAKHPLAQTGIVFEESIVHFLSERVQHNGVFKDQLLTIVKMSKDEITVSQAAANSITILVRAGVHFIGADLRGVRIPGANLSEGCFDSAQLQNSNLSGVRLKRTWLRQADLRGAIMADVRFGEKPYFEVPYLDYSHLCSVAVSWDGKILAAALPEGVIQVFHSFDFSECLTLQGHLNYASSVDISSDILLLASGGWDKTVRVWNLKEGKECCVFQGHSDEVNMVSFAPDSKHVASASKDGTARIWNIETESCLHTLNTITESCEAVAWSPCGHQIATGSESQCGAVYLWDASTGQLEWILDSRWVRSILYSRQGKLLATSGAGELFLWDLTLDDQGDEPIVMIGTAAFTRAVFSLDQQIIAAACEDGSIQLWNVISGSFIASLNGHSEKICGMAFLDDQELLSACEDMKVRFWQLEDELRLKENSFRVTDPDKRGHREGIISLVYSPGGDFILTSSSDGYIFRWNTKTGDCAKILEVDIARTRIDISPNGQQLAVSNGIVRVYQLDNSDEPKVYCSDNQTFFAQFSPCGHWMASRDDEGIVRLWDLRAGGDERVLKGEVGYFGRLVFSPDDRWLVSLFANTVQLWDTESAKCTMISDFAGSAVSFSPCGNMLTITDGELVRLWDLRSREERVVFPLADIELRDISVRIAWSPCGCWIATSWSYGSMRLWRISDPGSEPMRCEKMIALDTFRQAMCISWSPTEPLVFSVGYEDGSLCVWRIVEAPGDGFPAPLDGASSEFRVELVWDSLASRLIAAGAKIDEVVGLTEMQKDLLIQRGAMDGSAVYDDEQSVEDLSF